MKKIQVHVVYAIASYTVITETAALIVRDDCLYLLFGSYYTTDFPGPCYRLATDS